MKQNVNEDDEVKIIGGGNLTYEEMMRKKHKDSFPKQKGLLMALFVLLCALICVSFYFLLGKGRQGYECKYETSRTTEMVLKDLKQYKPDGTPSVSMLKDSVNGVVFKLYTLKNLTMQIVMGAYPDEEDSTLYFVSRAMDYRKYSETMIGEFVIDGENMGEGRQRLAYLASLPGGLPQVGIGRDDEVTDFVEKHRGNMIRQFALVAAGQICTDQFELKGKVTRAAYAWKESEPTVLYFLETLTNETLYDFSEAIVDYGFTDAIYITDGVWPHRFYRNEKGIVCDTTAAENKKNPRQYLIFKTTSSR